MVFQEISFFQIPQIELTEVTEDTIDLEEDIFDGEDELLQVIHAKYLVDGAQNIKESNIHNFMSHKFTNIENDCIELGSENYLE